MAAREPGRGAGSGDAERSAAPPPAAGATALLAGAISYALGACAVVGPQEMSLPTPCQEWDLRLLLDHLAGSMADLETAIRTGRLGPDGEHPPDPDPDRQDQFQLLCDRAASLLCACYEARHPGRLVLVGGLPVPDGIVACTGAVEIAVHGWDVSAARGRGGPIPPGLATRMLRLCPLLVAVRRGLFADPVEVPPAASPGDRLVAYLGRAPGFRNTPGVS